MDGSAAGGRRSRVEREGAAPPDGRADGRRAADAALIPASLGIRLHDRSGPATARAGLERVSAGAADGIGLARWLAWGLVGLGALVVARLVWASRGWPLVHDAPLMHYVAWRISEGAAPYRDVFDMNFPGVYLLHLLVLRALGPGDLAWRAFDLAWLAAGALAAAAFASAWGRLASATAAVLFALYHLSGGAWQAGQRDFLLCPLLLAGALGVARWIESRARTALLWGGLALGASVTIKPHAMALVAALGVVVALAARRARGSVLGGLALYTSAVALVPLAIVGWVGAAGGLPAWRAIVLDYVLPLYSRLGRGAPWNVHRPEVFVPIGVGMLLTAAAALAGRRFGARHVVAVLGVLYGAAHFVVQGKGWEYHLYPLAAFAVVLLVAEIESALRRLRRPAAVALLLSVVLAGVLLAERALAVSPGGWERSKAEAVRRLAAEIAPRLRPGETVQVLDTTAGGIHALLRLGVRQPTRFLYDFQFFHDTDHPTIRSLRAELTRGLDARPPALIVLFELGWPAGRYERIDTFPELAARLARYDLVRTASDHRIYAQRHR